MYKNNEVSRSNPIIDLILLLGLLVLAWPVIPMTAGLVILVIVAFKRDNKYVKYDRAIMAGIGGMAAILVFSIFYAKLGLEFGNAGIALDILQAIFENCINGISGGDILAGVKMYLTFDNNLLLLPLCFVVSCFVASYVFYSAEKNNQTHDGGGVDGDSDNGNDTDINHKFIDVDVIDTDGEIIMRGREYQDTELTEYVQRRLDEIHADNGNEPIKYEKGDNEYV